MMSKQPDSFHCMEHEAGLPVRCVFGAGVNNPVRRCELWSTRHVPHVPTALSMCLIPGMMSKQPDFTNSMEPVAAHRLTHTHMGVPGQV